MSETTTITPTPVLEIPTTLRSLIEALVFAAQEPLTVKQIQSMYAVEGVNGDARKIEQEEISRLVEGLNEEYASSERPYRITQVAGGYQFATLPVYADWLGKLYKEQARRKLSQASTESLAIIAYRQPITKPEIESIRGVNCDYVLKTLLEKDMVTIVGRATTVGRPLLYGTTKDFLKHFGLNDISDLPRPREIQEILGESQFESERRMLEAQQGLQEKKEEDFKSRLPHIPKRKPALDDEVKIIPKKRVHDLKVEPDEKGHEVPGDSSTTASVAQEPTDETRPVVKSEDEPKTLQPLAEGMAPPSEIIIQPQAFLTTENIEPEPTEHAEEPEAAAEESASSVEEAPLATEPADIEPLAGEPTSLEDENPPTLEVIASAEVADATPTETSEEIIPEEAAALQGQAPVQEVGSAPVEGTVEEAQTEEASVSEREALPEEPVMLSPASEEKEPEITESHTPETERPVESVEQVEAKVEGTAQVLPPIIEEQPKPVLRPESAPASRPRSTAAAPHPRSRWQSWKEKIQGFIKKLFA